MKIWHIVALVAAAAALLYLFTRKSPVLSVGKAPSSSSGSFLSGLGTAASGLSDLWDSVSGSFGSAGKADSESGGDSVGGGAE